MYMGRHEYGNERVQAYMYKSTYLKRWVRSSWVQYVQYATVDDF